MGFGFTLKKQFAKVFNAKNLTLGKMVSVSLMAGLGGMGAGIALQEDPEGRSNIPNAAATYEAYKNEIAGLGRDNTEVFTLKRDRVTVAESLSYTAKKDAPAVKEKLKTMEKREIELDARLKDVDSKVYKKLALDGSLAESDVAGLVEQYTKAMGRAPASELYNLSKSSAFLNECRAVNGTDPAAVSSCAVAKTNADLHTSTQVQTFSHIGGMLLFFSLSVAGIAVRRRVDAEESEMKDTEARQGVDALREILKPQRPQL